MRAWQILVVGAVVGIAAVSFQFGWNGDPVREIGRVTGGAAAGAGLAYLAARAAGWLR